MKAKIINTFLILMLFTGPLPADEPADETKTNSGKVALLQDGRHFLRVGLGLASVPFQFQKGDWLKAGLVTGTTALLFLADKDIKHFAQRNHSNFNKTLFSVDQFWLNYPMFIMGGSIYSWGYFKKDYYLRRTGLKAIEAYFYAGLWSGVFKILIGRKRPNHGKDNLFFKPLQFFQDKYQSLPSGHSMTSFAVSTVLAKSTNKIYWKIFWYGTAGLVSAARVYHNKHWFSDVFCGAVLGYIIADYIEGFKENEKSGLLGIESRFTFSTSSIGLQICYNL